MEPKPPKTFKDALRNRANSTKDKKRKQQKYEQQYQRNTYCSFDEPYGQHHRPPYNIHQQQNRRSNGSTINGYNVEPVQLRHNKAEPVLYHNKIETVIHARTQPTAIQLRDNKVETVINSHIPPTQLRIHAEPVPSTSTLMHKQQPLLIQTVTPENYAAEQRHYRQQQELQNKIHDLEQQVALLTSEKKVLEQQNAQFKNFQQHMHLEAKSKADKRTWHRFMLNFKLFNRPSKEFLEKKNILKPGSNFDNELQFITHSEKHPLVPKIMVECIETIESNITFLKTDGIYRASGNHNIMQQMRIDVDNNKYYKIRENKDPYTIAGFLKLFLRELKEPILSYAHLENGIPHLKDFRDDHIVVKIGKLCKLLQSLPEHNKQSLKYLIKHLDTVAEEYENNMNATTLSLLFGPCIVFDVIRYLPTADPMDSFVIPNLCIETMINNYEEIFESKNEMKEEDSDDSSEDGTAV